jgi:UPF0176 protein
MSEVVVVALYHFVALDKPERLRQPLLGLMHEHGVRGTILLANEGINGTVAGSREAIDALLAWLIDDPRFAGLEYKESVTDEMPFYRSKVKLKKEIVTMGVTDIDPAQNIGTYVEPRDWNALIEDPDITLIDTRNDYEVQIGSFDNAINPKTSNFREFPGFVEASLDPKKNKKVAMFCTGGIRCEKSTAYLKQRGFAEVYQLHGGILKYLEEVPEEESHWHGECFVFDERVTVEHKLNKGHYDQCHACRMPITEQDKKSEHYIPGISCPFCFDKTSAAQRQRFAERQKQVQLARHRAESHIGSDIAETIRQRKAAKLERKNRQRGR